MFLGFITWNLVALIAHLFGVALGAGGAYMSDGIFFKSVSDGEISKDDYKFIRFGSTMVWIGLALLVASGIALFLFNVDRYLHSTKFLAKMTIVLILTINGVFFHVMHMPKIKKVIGEKLRDHKGYGEFAHHLLISGAISVTSWSCALILGAFHGIPYSYWTIMGVYVVIVGIALAIAFWKGPKMIGYRGK